VVYTREAREKTGHGDALIYVNEHLFQSLSRYTAEQAFQTLDCYVAEQVFQVLSCR